MPSAHNNGDQNLPKDEGKGAYCYAANLCVSFAFSMALRASVELELFDVIWNMEGRGDDHGISTSEIASYLHNSCPNATVSDNILDRLLFLLSSNSLLSCSLRFCEDGKPERVYKLTPCGKYFMKHNGNGETLAMFTLFNSHQDFFVKTREFPKEAIIEGGNPWDRAHDGIPFFKYMESNATLNNIYNEAMTGVGTITTNKLVETYEGFEGMKSLVDVGGGNGKTLSVILSKYPSIKAINFDSPEVILNSPCYTGIEHIAGDMFAAIPKGDAILLKTLCHNWDDDYCVKLLSRAYEALPQNGKVIIVDRAVEVEVDSCTRTRLSFQLDVLRALLGEKERAVEDYKALSEMAGFAKFEVVGYAGACVIMELHKD